MADTKPQHTAGPWKFSPHGDGYLVTRYDVYVAGHGICGVMQTRAATEQQCEANARLIAAAPEMLAALRAFEYAENYEADETDHYAEAISNANEMMRAAISKAEGR